MFVLAHFSDLHLSARPRLKELAGKRGLGFINWHRGRKHAFAKEALDAITADLRTFAPDHVVVTGDLVNFSVPPEYLAAGAWLQMLGPSSAVTVVPGNHDIYVAQARRWPSDFWGDYMRGDDSVVAGAFPFLRRRGAVVLIALCSALPTAPLLATGRLGEKQLSRLAAVLEETGGLFRVVLIHHPPVSPPERHLRRLTDGAEFCRVLAQKGAELVLHGHDHCHSLVWLDGPKNKIAALGVPAASARAPHGSEDAAGYELLRIDGEPGRWRCEMVARQRGTDGLLREFKRQKVV